MGRRVKIQKILFGSRNPAKFRHMRILLRDLPYCRHVSHPRIGSDECPMDSVALHARRLLCLLIFIAVSSVAPQNSVE